MRFFLKTASHRYRPMKTAQDSLSSNSTFTDVTDTSSSSQDLAGKYGQHREKERQPKNKGRSSMDLLNLSYNQDVISLLADYGTLSEGGTKLNTEMVLFSDYVIKINTWNRCQERTMMVTSKAVYNLVPGDFSRCRRRIPLEKVASVSVSQTSDEFVLHVPSEYDYRLVSSRKQEILEKLKVAYERLCCTHLSMEFTTLKSLKNICMTRHRAKKIKQNLAMEAMKNPRRKASEPKIEYPMRRKAETTGNCDSADLIEGGTVHGWEQEKSDVKPSDFELLKVLGRGSFGKVMLVRKKAGTGGEEMTDSSRQPIVYAMKTLQKASIIKRNQVEHTKDEREILVSIDHPFLMKLHCAFQTPTKLYFVMDYLRGGELFFHLKQAKRFSLNRTRLYAAEIMLGIGHLHEKNIIYRDLKPENILLDQYGHICLTDFGLSKKFNTAAISKAQRNELGELVTKSFCGTPEYLAPEVLIGKGHTKDVDWWSLGILVYEMLVGLPPFYSENVSLMYEKIQHQPLKIPSFLHKSAAEIIRQLLNRCPEKRLGSGSSDYKEVMTLHFFKDLDWDHVYHKRYIPEFIPRVAQVDDTTNFDTEFTSEPVVDSIVPGSVLSGSMKTEMNFAGFTYEEQSALSKVQAANR